MKRCAKCHEEKPLTDFHADKYQADGRVRRCKVCLAEMWNQPEERVARAARQRVWQYGLSADAFDDMMEQQGGKCALCGFTFLEGAGKLNAPAVDHCHKSGKVRGLLCHRCNLGVGHFRDDLAIAKAAVAYLERTA